MTARKGLETSVLHFHLISRSSCQRQEQPQIELLEGCASAVLKWGQGIRRGWSSHCQLIIYVTYCWDSDREQVTWQDLGYKNGGSGKITDFVIIMRGRKWVMNKDILLQNASPCGRSKRNTTLSPALGWGFCRAMLVWRVEEMSPAWWNKPLAFRGPPRCFQLPGLKIEPYLLEAFSCI